MKNFKDLIVWQKAHTLFLEIHKVTRSFPKEELFVLTSQLRRAALSVVCNIVEGFKRKHSKEQIQFYRTSEASLEEVKYQLIAARDLGYLNQQKYAELEVLAEEVGKLLFGWIRSQRVLSP